jgi:hypothetical protein
MCDYFDRTFDSLNSDDGLIMHSKTGNAIGFDVCLMFELCSKNLESKREMSLADLFTLFSHQCGGTEPAIMLLKKSKARVDNELEEMKELAHLQCRFLSAFNELQRMGYVALATSGNLVRRTLLS